MPPPTVQTLLAALLLALPAAGQGQGPAAPEPVRARMTCEAEALRPGAANRVVVLLELEKDWHVYAPFVNDSGGPVAVDLQLPAGWSGRPTEGPAPRRHVEPGGLLDHVLEGRVALPLMVDVPAEAAGSRAVLRAHVSWMACRNVCLLGEVDVELAVRVADAREAPADGPDAALLREALKRVPRPFPDHDPELTATVHDGRLFVRAPRAAGLAFYPDADADAARCPDLLLEGSRDGTDLVVRLAPGTSDVRGVVEVLWASDRPDDLYRIRVSRTEPGPSAPHPEEKPDAR